ncbi:MAG: DsbA family protein [Ferruginibacter sp.]
MEKPTLIYCYDAYCGWCYGFRPVINKIALEYSENLDMEVLSGGMVIPEKKVHIRSTASYIQKAYKYVEELTGVKFGKDYLWHINNPEDSDWYPHSEKPAIALCIIKDYYPNRAIEIASDIQTALYAEGRDLTDDQAYLLIIEKYGIQPEVFFQKLISEEFKDAAYYEFSLVKQLEVDGFPAVFIQTGELKFHLVAKGFSEYETIKKRIDSVLAAV